MVRLSDGAPNELAGSWVQLKRGVLDYYVLAILTCHATYGYDLAATAGSAGGLEIGEGSVYPLLARLRRCGFVSTSWRTSNGGPPRRYYSVTVRGAAALTSFCQEWRTFVAAVDAVLQRIIPEGNPDGDQ